MEITETDFHITAARRLRRDELISPKPTRYGVRILRATSRALPSQVLQIPQIWLTTIEMDSA
jgi:hypothetical protein